MEIQPSLHGSPSHHNLRRSNMKKNQSFASGEDQGKMLHPLLSADEAGPGKQDLPPLTTSRGLQKNQTGPMDSLEDG